MAAVLLWQCDVAVDVQPECFPKWQALLDALEEIKQHSVATETENAASEGASKILIVARDDETCVQLRLVCFVLVLCYYCYSLFMK